ncbi:MAG: hypothetical protein Q8Q79_00190 [Sphingopyxis sp.]|nr:hypothetical protein [Sphingopyxis sp.]
MTPEERAERDARDDEAVREMIRKDTPPPMRLFFQPWRLYRALGRIAW